MTANKSRPLEGMAAAAKPKQPQVGPTFVYDNRLPGSDLPATNPANPRTLMRNVLESSAQTTADTRYDLNPPARERAGFTNPVASLASFSPLSPVWTTIVAIATVVGLFVFLILKKNPLPVRILLSVLLIVILHYLAGLTVA